MAQNRFWKEILKYWMWMYCAQWDGKTRNCIFMIRLAASIGLQCHGRGIEHEKVNSSRQQANGAKFI